MGFEPEDLQRLSIQFVPFIMAVVFHEYAHGFVANRWGDTTARDEGRLTLNPVPHMDFFGTLLLPILMMASGVNILFGWAKPVPINPTHFKRYRAGLFCVSFAGPLMNVLLAILSAALLCTTVLFVPDTFYLKEPIVEMTKVSIALNYALALFNLLPLPPLDGSKILESLLPLKLALQYEKMAQFGFLILLVAAMGGYLRFLFAPIQFLTELTLTGMVALFSLPAHYLGVTL
jgi:Zn-dependent protease